MKRIVLLLLASISLGLGSIGCGSKSSSTATPPATDPGINGGGPWSQCQPWQVYTTQFGCLNPGSCPSGYGYNPGDARCYRGTIGSEIPQGTWDEGISVVNISKFQKMIKDLGRCYMKDCPSASWAYLSLQIFGENYQYGGTNGGWGAMVPGYNQSSAFHMQFGYNYGAPQSRSARINLYTAHATYGYAQNIQFTSSAYPSQDGFKVIVNGMGHTSAYNERIKFHFTYLNAEKTQLRVQIIYQNEVVAEGTVTQ